MLLIFLLHTYKQQLCDTSKHYVMAIHITDNYNCKKVFV